MLHSVPVFLRDFMDYKLVSYSMLKRAHIRGTFNKFPEFSCKGL